jgi:SAM-dependent methyltransferase
MIDVVKDRKKEEASKGNSLWSNVETNIWNAENLTEAADESFSHVTAGLLLFMTAKPQCVLQETLRVLKPGGVFAMSSFKSVEWMDFIEEHLAIVKPGSKLGTIPEAWASTSAVERELERTGFKRVETEEVQVWYEFDDAEAMTRFNMNIIPSVKMVTAGWKEEEIEGAINLQIEELEKRFPDGKGRLGGVALVGFGTK